MTGIKVMVGVLVAAALATWAIAAHAKDVGTMTVVTTKGSYTVTLTDDACSSRDWSKETGRVHPQAQAGLMQAPPAAMIAIYRQRTPDMEVYGCYIREGDMVGMLFVDGDKAAEEFAKFQGV